MSQQAQSRKYEENYAVLERITESLNKDEVGIDDLVEKTREALNAARTCMEILNKQKGEFKKLETQFSQLLQTSSEPGEPPAAADDDTDDAMDDTTYDATDNAMDDGTGKDETRIGEDDPF